MNPVGKLQKGGHRITKFVLGSYRAAVLWLAALPTHLSSNNLLLAWPSAPGLAQIRVGLMTVSVARPECLCTFGPVEEARVSSVSFSVSRHLSTAWLVFRAYSSQV